MARVFEMLEDPERADPLHDRGSVDTTWTTTNTQEAMPGVATPLTWSFFFERGELAMRGAFFDLGALSRSEVRVPSLVDDRFMGMFCGRFAGNLDMMRRMGDQMPGSSGDAVEEQYFGHARQGIASARKVARLPVVMAKVPWAAVRSRRLLRAYHPEVRAWWEASVAPSSTTGLAEARARLLEAVGWWGRICRPHAVVSMIGQGLYEQVRRLCASVGLEGVELQLLSSVEATEEEGLVRDLWAVSRGDLPFDAFLGRWGFHGPAEGELSSRSWREDPSPVEALLGVYRQKDDREDPDAMRARVADERAGAEARLMALLSRPGRWKARFLLAQARALFPMRELGRGTFLRAYDVARAMVRRIGDDLVAAGELDASDDAFYLTVDELGAVRGEARELVAFRRGRRALYETLDLPERWTGEPEVSTAKDKGAAEDVSGIGVSAGVAEGRAVVMLEPDDALVLEPGDLLVCRTTDPSWSAFFMVAGGVVIDIGGPMSHGAILSRELGIPCVINTRVGTQALHTGDRIRIDGTKGTVEMLAAEDSVAL